MSEDQSPSDKPYDATPHKLEEARRKGQIVRSTDLNTAVIYGGFLASAGLLAPWAADGLGRLMQVLLGQADRIAPELLAFGGPALAAGLMMTPVTATAAAVLVPAVLLIAILLAQRAVLFTPSNLAPKLSRISPMSNAVQKFGPEGLFQFAKSSVKLALVSVLLAVYLIARADPILSTLYADPGQILLALGRMTLEFLAVITVLALAIGAVDRLWEGAQHQRKNRMSRQELMDETKSSEGDPHMKQQRRGRAQAIAMNQMLADVPKADVVVVNPTHFAVALRWDRAGGGVPVCVAKGVDETARRIREIAAEAGVPVFSDPPTARSLHAMVEIGAAIRPDHFRAVAAAIRFADLMRVKARSARR
ncbi:EscU/YscU/HrcU family type III secretion system export apparatus switch protein [Roseicyclus mahoneyensis]|uniref:Flagellar biosynthetic protein FlhB n=1 Tax=Roseicyclus mahoneyensis TaxID=164332 RepID=A0A316GG03_9RHOB|nr:flagellar type III secretion system protein FlhB [Roseicyclus mahoneyensis]PWK59804.1 flagellar biosynthetic protein FlhB [Roseicyclus mahoneyensis]